jgi:predicted transcriptional regulator
MRRQGKHVVDSKRKRNEVIMHILEFYWRNSGLLIRIANPKVKL